MNFFQAGAAAPRQALVLAIMRAICAPRDSTTKRTGSFLAISSDVAVVDPLCGLVGRGLAEGHGALVVVYPSAGSNELNGLVLVRRIGDSIFAQTVDPYWPVAQRRISLIPRSCRAHAFHVDDDDELRGTALPANADLTAGIAAAWRRIAETVANGEIDGEQWSMAHLTAA